MSKRVLHTLSDICPEERTGVCIVCGPVKVYSSGRRRDGSRAWTCGARALRASKEWSRGNPRTSGRHSVSNVDVDARTGVCVFCGPVKVYRNGEHKGKVYWACARQNLEYAREKLKDPRTDLAKRNARFLRKYGITLKQYDQMLEGQGGVCARCKKPPVDRRLAVDHCHKTGKVRMLLCGPCNTWLGRLDAHRGRLRDDLGYLDTGRFADVILESLASD